MTTEAMKQAVLDAVTGDPAFNTLVGATGDDPRLYWFYQGDAKITPQKPGYVTYAMTAKPEQTTAVEEPSMTFVVWARDIGVVEGVRDRLVAVLASREVNFAGLTVGSGPTALTLWGTVVNEADMFQQQPQYAGRNMVIKFGSLNLR